MSGRHSTRRHTAPRLAWRQFAADPWVSVGLALLIGLVSLMLTAVPRAFTDVQSRQLVQDVDAMSSAQRDVTGQWTTSIQSVEPFQGQDSIWDPIIEGVDRIRTSQPSPLADILRPAHIESRFTRSDDVTPDPETGYFEAAITLASDPYLTDHVTLVTGEWPELFIPEPTRINDHGVPIREPEGNIPVIVLHEAAEEMMWELGDVVSPHTMLVGTYTPTDPDDKRWDRIENGSSMGLLFDANRGYKAVITAYLSPDNPGTLGAPNPVRIRAWYPVDPSAVTGSTADLSLLRSQLTGMLAQGHVVATPSQFAASFGEQRPSISTELPTTIDAIIAQQRSTASLLAVVVAGPLGVAMAVAALSARLLVHRRSPGLTLTLARGASPTQLRQLIAIEGLTLGVPAALGGHLAAMALIPGPTPWWQWLVTGVVAVVPSVTLALSIDDASLLQGRSDLSGRSSSRWRWVAELAVVTLAAVATWRLLDRPSRADDPAETGIDLLAAGAPVLLALAACVVALRLYPWPLTVLTGVLKRGRALTSFVGAARALRDPAGGVVPTLAVVLGTAIALVSAVLLTTVVRGAEVAAWQANGAPVRLVGPPLNEGLREQLGDVEGIAAIAGIRDSTQTRDLSVDGQRSPIRLVISDSELQEVYAAALVHGPPPDFFAADGTLKVMVGPGVNVAEGADTVSISGLGQVEVLGQLNELPGVRVPGTWAMVDRAVWEAATGQDATQGAGQPATTTLMSLEPGADRQQAAGAVRGLIAAGVVDTPDERLDRFAGAPVTEGLRSAFVGAALITGLLTVLAIVIVQLMGSTARLKLLSVLRTLGMAPRQTRALTTWEMGPLVVTSLVVGAAVGLLIPWLLLQALDLRGLTGGITNPALHIDPVVVALVLGAVLVTVMLAVTVSAWLAGRTNLAQALRVGEER